MIDKLVALTYIVILISDFCRAEELIQQNHCVHKETCRQCIQTPTCAWCAQPTFNGKRCFRLNANFSSNVRSQCEAHYFNNPENEYTVVESKKFQKPIRLTRSRNARFGGSDGSSPSGFGRAAAGSAAVQISPQRVSLKLRINEVHRIAVNFAQVEDYPVDLYYLMDLSNSMEDDKENLSVLGNLLAESMRNITFDFRLRFGSFVDKVGMPYVNTMLKTLLKPCYGCEVPPYGFKNGMSLSQDTHKFFSEVQRASVSGNLDSLEGGFDAIMQAIVCREQIGWREGARRLLVFSTDAGFHYAGDGKKISSSVEMKDTASSFIKVTYYSTCGFNNSGLLKQTNKCDGLKIGSVVSFQAEIEVTTCPPNREDRHQIFKIYPVGINESLTVSLDMHCDCPCKMPGNSGYHEKSPDCRGSGTLKCGICECDPMHFGRACECDANDNYRGNNTNVVSGCRLNDDAEINCSGRGECNCGQCYCRQHSSDPDERIYGAHCECDNFSCDRSGGVLCGGHGLCDCGVCKCNREWTGPSCDCRATNETCIMEGSDEVCSGRGNCECGQCKCSEKNGTRYSGKYCQKCSTCSGRCREFIDCVQCLLYKIGHLSPSDCKETCAIKPIIVKELEADENKDEYTCSHYDTDNYCRFTYVYSFDRNGKVIIRAQGERECYLRVYLIDVIMSIVGAVVMIGLTSLLLWKLLMTINDRRVERREYVEFEKELRTITRWHIIDNPIYKQAMTKFENPTYTSKL